MPIRRRDFIATGTAAGVAQLLGTSRTWAGANDRIRLAIIGLGGRGRDHMRQALQIPGIEVAAFCDPDENCMTQKAAEFESLAGKRPELHQDLRRVLEDRNVDAVTIASCNHWHALAAIWACQAGKHVYVEKPVCHDMFSGAQMVAASRKYNRIVQGGTQRRSNGYIRRGIQALREGMIGDVYMARCVHYQERPSLGFKSPGNPPAGLDWNLWVGPGPMQPFHGNLHPYNWHWFWDFGNGELGNNGVHFMDVARWGLNKKLPSSVHSVGGRFGYKDQAQTPNTQLVTYSFEDETEMVIEIRGRYTNGEDGLTSGVAFHGSKGYMILDSRGRSKVFLGGRSTPEADLGRLDDIEWNGHEESSHLKNFFDAVREGKRDMLTAEIHETYLSTVFCLLGNISHRLKRELRFDPGTQRCVGDREADTMLRDRYRPPFSVPENV